MHPEMLGRTLCPGKAKGRYRAAKTARSFALRRRGTGRTLEGMKARPHRGVLWLGLVFVAFVLGTCPSRAQEGLPRKAIFMVGYRGYDVALFTEAMEGIGIACEKAEQWVPTEEYVKYGTVVVAGGPNMGKTNVALPPGEYSAADIANLVAYLDKGGNLLLLRYGPRIFGGDGSPARKWLAEAVGKLAEFKGQVRILRPEHPWMKPLATGIDHPWLASGHEEALVLNGGGAIVGMDDQRATLCEVAVGKGRLVYVGWHVALNKPRGKVSPEAKDAYEEQVQIIQGVAQTLRGSLTGR